MSYKTILVHLDNGRRAPVRLELAVQLAQRFDAHLVGLYALAGQYAVTSSLPEPHRMVMEAERPVAVERAKQMEAIFRRVVDRGGHAGAEWTSAFDAASGVVPLHGHYADLVLIGQHDSGERSRASGLTFLIQLVLTAGRPVLAVPYAGQVATVGKAYSARLECQPRGDARRNGCTAILARSRGGACSCRECRG